jgi:hypothetical protein
MDLRGYKVTMKDCAWSVDSGGYRARLQSDRIWEERSGGWATEVSRDSENKFSTPTAPRQRIRLMYNPLDRRSYPVDRRCSWKDNDLLTEQQVDAEVRHQRNDAKEWLNMLAVIFPGGHGRTQDSA